MKIIRTLKPYLVTLLIIGFLVSIKLSIPSLNTLVLSLAFFFGIILVTRYFGLGPGFLFLFVSTFIYLRFLIMPDAAKGLYTTAGIIRLLAFFLQFSIIIFIIHQFSRLKKRQTASEIRFKALIEKSHTAVVLLNEQAKKIYVSPTIQPLLGYTPEEFMVMEPFALLEPEILNEYQQQFLEFKKEYGKSITLTHKYKHKNGNYIFVESTITNLLDQKGVNAIVINFRDLNEQKEAEEIARRKTNSLEILNEIGISISEQLDLQSILQKVTDATTRLSGAQFGAFFYNAVKPDGESYLLYTLSGASREKFEKFGMPRNTAVFHPTFSGEGVVRVDDITKDPRYGKNPPHNGMPEGHLPVVSYLAVPVISKNGEVIGGLFFGHSDKGVFTAEAEQLVTGVAAQAAIAIENARLIDDLKEANRENQRLLKLAGELDEKKDEFISIASHELKTPLTSIKAYVQLLQREVGGQPGDKPYQYFQKTDNYINKLQSLIEDLLNVSKIQAGKLEYNMDSFSMSEVVRETIDGFQNTVNSHSITLHTEEDAIIYGDKQRLEQVLTNLLSNAVKYSPENKSVEIAIKRNDENVVVSVKDYGIGISPEDHPKLFDRFQRVTNDKRFSGLGIGLFISCEIVKRHDGKMWVESTPGNGSTFYFSLPVKEETQAA